MGNAPEVLLTIRRAWQCDCDGESHRQLFREPSGADRAMSDMRAAIEDYTGHAPVGCPWRAMYEPIVIEAIHAATLADKGLGGVAFAEDAPAVWIDAVRVYLTARESVRAKDWKAEIEARKRKAGK